MAHIEPLVFTSLWLTLAVLIIVTIGAVVQAGLGMGFGLTVAPVLALLDPALVPAPALYLGMATAIVGAITERENIAWPEVGLGMLGRASGIGIGLIALLFLVDRSLFSLVFGIIILIAVFLSVVGWSLQMSAMNLLSMCVISGFTGVITSVGAPPLALIYQNLPAQQSRPTLAAFFAFGGAISLLALYASGWAGVHSFYLALFMAPAAIFGTWLGRRFRGRFDSRYRPALLAIAAIASVLLIIRGLSG